MPTPTSIEAFSFDSYYTRAFPCPCCTTGHVSPQVIATARALFHLIGHRFKITSAYRCPYHNAKVGGLPNSAHLAGRALDLAPLDFPMPLLVRAALSIPAWAYGVFGWAPDRGTIHLEVADRPASWCLTNKGYCDLWTTWQIRYPMHPLPRVPATLRVPIPAPSVPSPPLAPVSHSDPPQPTSPAISPRPG